MEQNNIITYLYDKKVEDNLFTLEDVELTRLKEKVTIVDKEISNFIAKRVHPKSRKKLQRLLLEYSNAIFITTAKENELYYKSGTGDGIKFIIDSLSSK